MTKTAKAATKTTTTKAAKLQAAKNARRIVRAYLRCAIECTMSERIPADLGATYERLNAQLDAALATLAAK